MQAASGSDPGDLLAHVRGCADKPTGHAHRRLRNGIDDRFGDIGGQFGARPAAEGDEHRVRVATVFVFVNERGIEQREARTSERHAATRARVHRHAAINHQVSVEASETQIVHADHKATGTTPRGHPAARVGGHGVVHNEHIRCERVEHTIRAPVDDIAAERQRGFLDLRAATQGDQRTHTKGTGQRSTPHEMTEAAPRPGRSTKQNSKVSAGRHDTLR